MFFGDAGKKTYVAQVQITPDGAPHQVQVVTPLEDCFVQEGDAVGF